MEPPDRHDLPRARIDADVLVCTLDVVVDRNLTIGYRKLSCQEDPAWQQLDSSPCR